jgi:hypothetical protein
VAINLPFPEGKYEKNQKRWGYDHRALAEHAQEKWHLLRVSPARKKVLNS